MPESSTRTTAQLKAQPAAKQDPLRDPGSPESRQLAELKQRDREVRAHEQAHVAAGGAHVTGGQTYSYQRGPDGRAYAVGGEVQIDTSPVPGEPQETIRKMQQVQQAALAPAEPSAQDRAVAAQAAQQMAQARLELQRQTALGEDGQQASTKLYERLAPEDVATADGVGQIFQAHA